MCNHLYIWPWTYISRHRVRDFYGSPEETVGVPCLNAPTGVVFQECDVMTYVRETCGCCGESAQRIGMCAWPPEGWITPVSLALDPKRLHTPYSLMLLSCTPLQTVRSAVAPWMWSSSSTALRVSATPTSPWRKTLSSMWSTGWAPLPRTPSLKQVSENLEGPPR